MTGNCLVIQTAFLGDVILTTGLLSHLADQFGPVDVVVTPGALPLLATHPAVRTAIPFDKRGTESGPLGFLRLANRLRNAGYARAYLPHRSLRTALLARTAAIPERIGFAGSPGAWSYTRRVVRPETGHDAERILALAEPSAGTAARVSLGLTEDDQRHADEWLRKHGISGPFVAVAPGSIWGTKRWTRYAELVAALPGPIVVLGSKEDRSLAEEVARAAPERAHAAAGELPLMASAALIQRATVLVTNDSAPLHLASAVGTRVVALFGPTVPAFGFGPRGAADVVVEQLNLSCRPCSSHGPQVCPLGHHRCMTEISAERVLHAVHPVPGAP